jgi:P-type conjugative transfer protein TrbJ
MKNIRNKTLMGVVVVAAVTLGNVRPAPAQLAVACVNCSTVMDQLLQYAQQLRQAETELSAYATQLQQYANMVQNTAAVPMMIYSDAMSDMQRVQSLMTAGSNLNFNNPGATLSTFSSFLNNGASLTNSLTSQANLLSTWSQRSVDGITAAMNAIAGQNAELSTDNATMMGLQSQASSATGQMQAMQNVAQIAAQGVRETEKLRQLIMVQVQLEANKQANASERQSQSQAAWQNFVSAPPLSDSGVRY